MEKATKKDILYKEITGENIIDLYRIFVNVSEEYNKKHMDDRNFYEKFPEFSIELPSDEVYSGSELSELEDFIRKQKKEIVSIRLALRINSNNIVISLNKEYKQNNNYKIAGDKKWVFANEGAISEIIANMEDLPKSVILVNQHRDIFFVICVSILMLFLLFNYDFVGDFFLPNVNIFAIFIISLPISFFTSHVVKYLNSFIEFRLNPDYKDSSLRKRDSITKGIYWVGSAMTIYTLFNNFF